MRVAVIGAGIVGVTTAHELACDGHEVTVFERRGAVAEETSFANAGVLAPGYVTPWAAPGMPGKVLRQLFVRDAAVRFGGVQAWALLPWMWRWWRACRPAVYRRNRGAMQALAHYSRQRLMMLTNTLGIDYEQAQGYLVLLRTPREVQAAQAGLALLRELEVPHALVDAARCRELEPGLNGHTPLSAAIHLPHDGVGNCRQFAQALRQESQRLGARYRFEHEVRSLVAGARPEVQVLHRSQATAERFEAVVVCAGVEANRVLRDCGLRLPLAPVHGYSITAPLRHFEAATVGPRAALMDERYKVAVSRLGHRVRVAGSAELGGSLDRHSPAAIRTLYRVLDDWFPGAANLRDVQVWKGARPMLPDGPPIVSAGPAPGIWLNLGHGSSGWALSCGSARVIADLIAGHSPGLDVAGLTLHRGRS